MSGLLDKTSQALGSNINMRLLRQNVTSANIANAETPGYKAKVVDFEDSLARALKSDSQVSILNPEVGNTSSISRVRPDVYDNPEANVSNDGNTVNLEKEMVSLTENSIMYRAAVELMNKKMAALKYAISEGGR